MNPLQRISELRLHTDHEGRIWFKEQGRDPIPADMSAEDFVNQPWVLEAERLLLLGSRQNAELILALHAVRCLKCQPQSVWLGNPRLAASEPRRLAPIFARMDSYELPPSLGGWRELVATDYVTYALESALKKSGGKLNNLSERLLREHPAWPALSFVGDLNKAAAAELVCMILDPRWHIDPAKPDARKRLNSDFGLGQEGLDNLRHLLLPGEDNPPGRYADRAKVVLDAWTGAQDASGYVPPTNPVGSRNFLWRIQAKPAAGAARGMLCASQVFLYFLSSVWLDNLTAARRYEQVTQRLGRKRWVNVTRPRLIAAKSYSPQLFVPAHFFELSAEVAEWNRHVIRLKQRAI